MVSVKLGGEHINLKGEPPEEGSQAPDFKFVLEDLNETSLSDFKDKFKVIMAIPSLDTGVCQKQTQIFNQRLSGKKKFAGIAISMDLPFAMKRFCSSESLDNIISASDFRYSDFANKFNLKITSGALKGLIARAVFVLDPVDKIVYREIVPEIEQEPDYDKALEALDKIYES